MDIASVKGAPELLSTSGSVSGISPAQESVKGNAATVEAPPSNEQIKKMVDDMSSQLAGTNISVNFATYGPDNNKIAVVVTDKTSGEIIREIPPKELQQLYQNMGELVGRVLSNAV